MATLHPERETGLAGDVEAEPTQGEVASTGEVSLEQVPTPQEEEEA
jgi:hypothetical protein